jgi:hypothetical protein
MTTQLNPLISIVSPVYKAEKIIPLLVERIESRSSVIEFFG